MSKYTYIFLLALSVTSASFSAASRNNNPQIRLMPIEQDEIRIPQPDIKAPSRFELAAMDRQAIEAAARIARGIASAVPKAEERGIFCTAVQIQQVLDEILTQTIKGPVLADVLIDGTFTFEITGPAEKNTLYTSEAERSRAGFAIELFNNLPWKLITPLGTIFLPELLKDGRKLSLNGEISYGDFIGPVLISALEERFGIPTDVPQIPLTNGTSRTPPLALAHIDGKALLAHYKKWSLEDILAGKTRITDEHERRTDYVWEKLNRELATNPAMCTPIVPQHHGMLPTGAAHPVQTVTDRISDEDFDEALEAFQRQVTAERSPLIDPRMLAAEEEQRQREAEALS